MKGADNSETDFFANHNQEMVEIHKFYWSAMLWVGIQGWQISPGVSFSISLIHKWFLCLFPNATTFIEFHWHLRITKHSEWDTFTIRFWKNEAVWIIQNGSLELFLTGAHTGACKAFMVSTLVPTCKAIQSQQLLVHFTPVSSSSSRPKLHMLPPEIHFKQTQSKQPSLHSLEVWTPASAIISWEGQSGPAFNQQIQCRAGVSSNWSRSKFLFSTTTA